MAIDLVSGSRHRTGRICQSFVTESTCLLRLGGEQDPQLRFQQGKGLAAVAMGFFLRERHLSEGEADPASPADSGNDISTKVSCFQYIST